MSNICGICKHAEDEHETDYGCTNADNGLCLCANEPHNFSVSKNDELAALRSLLSDAMKALEPFAEQAFEETNDDGEFHQAAEVAARIKATLTGGGNSMSTQCEKHTLYRATGYKYCPDCGNLF